ncbi:ESPR-type extended signal peptide-containing protein, partial [Kingella kingae]|uniref:ESPR-type extended signal peptide-containing protein n=1 Tax=Kingella kingae TaxID=504 RepID=UPI00254D37C2
MNHTYRVVYNESTNTYVAVAEFEPSKGKSKSSKKAIAAAIALAAAQLVPLTAQAAVSIGSASGKSITAEAATATENGVAVGAQAKANYSAVAVGSGASAIGTDVAVGSNATATGTDNIAIGNNSKASSTDSTLNYGIIAIGNQSNGSASEVVAIGQLACATASQAVALGSQTKATGDQSVAIGGNTVSSGASALAIGGDDLDKASGVGRSVNGVPNTTNAGLNNGTVNAKFKEISGQNLVKKTDNSSSTNNTEARYMATHAYGAASIAVGIQSRSGDLATAFGTQSFATGLASTALGVASNASGDGSIAVGPGTDATGEQSIGMGANATSSNNHSIAIGTNAITSGNQSISVGYANNVSGNNSGAFGDLSKITGSGAYTVGNNNTMAANEAGAFGNLNNFTSAANYSRAVGNNVTVSGSNTMVLGNDVNATTNGSVVLGNSSSGSMSVVTCSSATVNGITYGNFTGNVTDAGKYVSVGANATDARKIVNVAAGNIASDSTEAINGSQLYLITNQITSTTPLSNQENGTVSATPVKNTPNLVNATTVANAINKSGWVAKQAAHSEDLVTESTNINDSVINPGDNVSFASGKNLALNKTVEEGGNTKFTYGLVDKVSLTDAGSLTVGGTKLDNNGLTFVGAGTTTQSANTPSVTRTGINAGNLAVTNVAGNLAGAKTGTQAPTTSGTAPTLGTGADQVNVNNAATVGDVLNAGWNLQGNGVEKDFVKPYDTVNFVNGTGTTATVTSDGNRSNVSYNVAVDNKTTQLVDVAGKPVVKANDGKYYLASDVDSKTNTPNTGAQEVTSTQVAAKTTELAPQYVDASGNPVAAGKTGAVNSGKVATPTSPTSLVNASTVADAINNSGFNVIAGKVDSGTNSGKAPANKLINPGATVKFVAGSNMDIEQDGSTFTFRTNNQNVVENAQLPVVYTNAEGDKLVKGQDGNFYKPDDIAKATYDPTTKKYTNNTTGTIVAPATTVIASMNNGDNKTTAPMTLTNVKGNLVQTLNAGDLVENANGTLTVGSKPTAANAYTKSAPAPTTDQVAAMYNKAATVGDILNAGWNLQGNGQAVDFVKPYDTVNFVNGGGTTATVTSNGNVSNVSNVSYNVAVDNETTQIVDEKGKPLVKASDGKYYPASQVDSSNNPITGAAPVTNTQVAAKTTDLTVSDGTKTDAAGTTVNAGKVVTPTNANGSSLVNATTVANAINNSGWNLQANGDTASKVSPGNTVQFINGDNIDITRNGNNITVATSKDINVKGDLTVAGNTTVNNFTVNPNSTVNMGGNKITNVAAGEADTDAVNVSQLKSRVAASKEEVTSNDKTVRVNVSTNATTGANIYDVSVNTGKSLTINSTTGAIDVKTDGTTIKQGSTGALEVVTTNLTVANNGKVVTPTNANGSSLVNAT